MSGHAPSDLLGKSSRAMLDALVAASTDTQVLADLALGTLRTTIPALREALSCRFSGHHAVIVASVLSR